MSRRLRLAAPQQSPVQLLVHLPRLLGVHPRERRPASPRRPPSGRACTTVRQDSRRCPAGCSVLSVWAISIATNWPQWVMPRDIRPDLCLRARLSNSCLGTSLSTCANTVSLWATGLVPPVFSVGFHKPIIPAQDVPGPFSYGSSGTAVNDDPRGETHGRGPGPGSARAGDPAGGDRRGDGRAVLSEVQVGRSGPDRSGPLGSGCRSSPFDERLPLPTTCPDCGADVLARADIEGPGPPARPPFNALRIRRTKS